MEDGGWMRHTLKSSKHFTKHVGLASKLCVLDANDLSDGDLLFH